MIIILLVIAVILIVFIIIVMINVVLLHTEQAHDILAALCCTQATRVAGAFMSKRCQIIVPCACSDCSDHSRLQGGD